MTDLPDFAWKAHLRRLWLGFLERSRKSAGYLPSLWRKPRLAWHILKTESRLQMAVIATVLFMFFVAPSLTGSMAYVVHPRPKGPLAVVQKQNPRAEALADSLWNMLWIGSTGACLLLFWLRIPAAMASLARRSGRSERQADELRGLEPRQSLLLYQSALDLAADARDEHNLREKIRRAQSESVHLGGTAVELEPPATVGLVQRARQFLREKVYSERKFAVGTGGRYQLDRPLGQGGMGTVYKGVDTTLGRKVAIKGLPEGPGMQDFTSRFHQEAKALAALSHPGIVQVYDLVAEYGRVWIVLEYVEGGDLAGHLRATGPLDVAESAHIAHACAEALHHAHERGVVHRDFKPANVLMGAGGQPKITDFGLARLAGGAPLTQSGTILGSAPYMSPEQARGLPAEASADVYSLGITLFEMLTGEPPFSGEPGSVLAQHITQPPPSLLDRRPDVSAELSNLVARMLMKQPAERLADLCEVCAVLERHTARPELRAGAIAAPA